MDLWPVHAMRLLMPDVPPEPDAKAARLQRVTERGLVTFRLDVFQVVPSSLNKTVGIYTNKVSFEHIGSCGYCVAVTALLVCICWEPVKSWISGFARDLQVGVSQSPRVGKHSFSWRTSDSKSIPLGNSKQPKLLLSTGLSSTWIVSGSVLGPWPQSRKLHRQTFPKGAWKSGAS